MHMFFSLVCSTPGPISSLDTVSKFRVSQWDHTSSTVGYHDHVSTASSQRDCESQSTLNLWLHDNLVNRCGCWSSSHGSPLSETRHVSGNSLLKNISCLFMSDITYHTYSCQTSHIILIHVRHHVCVFICAFFSVPWRNTSVIVVKYLRAAPVGVHAYFRRQTCFDPSSR